MVEVRWMDLREVSKGTIEGSKLFHFFSSSQFFDARVLINSVGIDRWEEANSSFEKFLTPLFLFFSKKQGEPRFRRLSKLIKMKERWKIQVPLFLLLRLRLSNTGNEFRYQRERF